jgi:hypothetical protein
VLSGRGLCDGPITRPEESYRLWRVLVCDLDTSNIRRLKLVRVVNAGWTESRVQQQFVDYNSRLYNTAVDFVTYNLPQCQFRWPCGLNMSSQQFYCWDRVFESR